MRTLELHLSRPASAALLTLLLFASCRDQSNLPLSPETAAHSEIGSERVGQAKPKGPANSLGSAGGPSLSLSSSTGLSTVDLTDPSVTASGLAQALVGSGVSISNVVYAGANRAAGTFAGGTGIIGFEEGVILSTGDIVHVVGPNDLDNVTASNGTVGDAALSALSGHTTYDAAILEFDFVPNSDTIYVEYVFASDEYNEYVNTSFNDVFAFFVNGSNCAVIGQTPVSINTVNGGRPFNDPNGNPSNPDRYRNNDLSDGGGTINTEMDGLTVVLVCKAPVNAGVANHMRLAIADASDGVYDSNVFLKTGSFSTTPPPSANLAPTAIASAAPNPVEVDSAVTFSDGGSTDPEGGSLSFEWNFGDPYVANSADNFATTATATHVYTRAGTYTATLTVTDDVGNTGSDEITVRVDNVVVVSVSGSPAVAGITVALTNKATGEFFLALTDANGKARFRLGADDTGEFVLTARRFSGDDAAHFEQAPPRDGVALPRGHEGLAAYSGVVFDAGSNTALNLDEVSYCTGVNNPLVQTDGSPSTAIALVLPKVATVSGSLLDANGNPFTLGADEHVVSVRPFLPEDDPQGCTLPPRFLNPNSTLPRALLIGSTTMPAGSTSSFVLPGATAGVTVLETNPVTLPDGETVVYRVATEVTETQETSGGSVEVVAGPAPALAHTFYFFDPLDDASRPGPGNSPTDIGLLLTAGFKPNGTDPSDVLAISSGFQGLGHYTLEVWTQDPANAGPVAQVTAVCQAKRCTLLRNEFLRAPAGVAASGVNAVRKGLARGTVSWEVQLPNVPEGAELWFRVTTAAGRSATLDAAPNAGYFRIIKRGGGGNTWDISSP